MLVGAVLVVAGGVAVNQVDGPLWSQVLAFSIAVILAVASTALSRRDSRRLVLRISSENGGPPLIGEADLLGLGIQPSSYGPSSPYVRRDRDVEELIADLDRRMVVVSGPRLAGASRSLAHAALLLLPEQRLVCFEHLPSGPSLRELVAEADWVARNGSGAVLWLDRADLPILEQISPTLIDSLPDNLRIFLTVDESLLNPAVLPADTFALLTDSAYCRRLGLISPSERERLADISTYSQLAAAHDGIPALMGQIMVSVDRVKESLVISDRPSLARAALLRAVTDWTRLQVPEPLGKNRLLRLARLYWRDLASVDAQSEVSAADLASALKSIASPSQTEFAPLLTKSQIGGQSHYRPHSLLSAIADDRQYDEAWRPPEYFWRFISDLSLESRRIAGLVAYSRGDRDGARQVLGTIDPTTVSQEIAGGIGKVAFDVGDIDSARRWWRVVINSNEGEETQILEAMISLGILEGENGDIPEARRWLRKVINSRDHEHAPRAMHLLGTLESQLGGDVKSARRWLNAAIKTNHPIYTAQAAIDLGVLEYKSGMIKLARRLFRVAINSGQRDFAPKAMINLGALEFDHGEVRQGRRWLQAAIDSGHPDESPKAMRALGVLEERRGNSDRAQTLLRTAIESGHRSEAPQAMVDLARLEAKQNRPDAARMWFQSAIAAGMSEHISEALFSFGLFEQDQGDLGSARRWYQAAIDTGHPDNAPRAMMNLGKIEMLDGAPLAGRYWYQRAISSGHLEASTRAKIGLGRYVQDSDPDAARALYRECIDAGFDDAVPGAMTLLGTLEVRQFDFEEGRKLLRAAVKSKDEKASLQARRELARIELAADEQRRAEQWAAHGYNSRQHLDGS